MPRMEGSSWWGDNWFVLLQSLGIIGGLFFTGISLRIDARVRRVGNLFEVTRQHREIWTELYSRPELKRVLDKEADVFLQPISVEEELFVNLLILHLASNHRAAREGIFSLPTELRSDVNAFFALPIPREIWRRTRMFQEKDFVRVVEGMLAG